MPDRDSIRECSCFRGRMEESFSFSSGEKYDKSTVEFLTVVAWFINVFKKYKISRLELDLKIFQIIFRSEKEKLGKFFDKIKVSRFKRY